MKKYQENEELRCMKNPCEGHMDFLLGYLLKVL
jgi:hypothetical protein